MLFRSKSFKIYSGYKISRLCCRDFLGASREQFSLDKSYMFGMVGKLQDLKKYRCSFAQSVLTPKRLKGQRPINISTGFDLCAQQLLVLITGSKIKPFSDSNGYDFKFFRSAHNALGQLKKNNCLSRTHMPI